MNNWEYIIKCTSIRVIINFNENAELYLLDFEE